MHGGGAVWCVQGGGYLDSSDLIISKTRLRNRMGVKKRTILKNVFSCFYAFFGIFFKKMVFKQICCNTYLASKLDVSDNFLW